MYDILFKTVRQTILTGTAKGVHIMKNQGTHAYKVGDLIDYQRPANGMCVFVFFGEMTREQVEQEIAYQYGCENEYKLTKELPCEIYEYEYSWLNEYDLDYRGNNRVTIVAVTEYI